jgi:HTH-type transcriptional regulator, competence development regulator
MSTETVDAPNTSNSTFGPFLKSQRVGRRMTLRDVEEASENEISNAYLSQLENGKIAKPSPHILHTLATIYSISYEDLMDRAGYLSPTSTLRSTSNKHGSAATRSIGNLSASEEKELLDYLAFFRSRRKSG